MLPAGQESKVKELSCLHDPCPPSNAVNRKGGAAASSNNKEAPTFYGVSPLFTIYNLSFSFSPSQRDPWYTPYPSHHPALRRSGWR